MALEYTPKKIKITKNTCFNIIAEHPRINKAIYECHYLAQKYDYFLFD
jgi:hypothetical protein